MNTQDRKPSELHWLVRPATIRLLWRGGLAILAVLTLAVLTLAVLGLLVRLVRILPLNLLDQVPSLLGGIGLPLCHSLGRFTPIVGSPRSLVLPDDRPQVLQQVLDPFLLLLE